MDEGPLGVHQVELVIQPKQDKLIKLVESKRRIRLHYLAQASAMAVVFESIHTARCTCDYKLFLEELLKLEIEASAKQVRRFISPLRDRRQG